MKRIILGFVGGLVLWAAVGSVRAGVEADPNKDYIITPEVGPFAICVRGYSGDTAYEKARYVVLKLRQNGWPAYMYDFSAEEEHKAKEILEDRYRCYPPDYPRTRKIRVEKHWGVFVGGYKSLEDAGQAAARLKREPKEKWPESIYCDAFVDDERKVTQMNPYFQSFASRNPAFREAKTTDTSAEDAIIKKLNANRPYNMLACAGRYTLIVKIFEGGRMVQAQSKSDQFLEALGMNKQVEPIDALRTQAEEVARVLRQQMKLDAYVLHTRTESVLSIGAFDDPESPAVKQMVERIKNIRFLETINVPPTTQNEKQLVERTKNIRLSDDEMRKPPPPAFQFLPEPTLLKVRAL